MLIDEWKKLSKAMDCYPYSYIAICADKLRITLGGEDSELNIKFCSMLWTRMKINSIVRFCKRHAPATMWDLKNLARVQRDVINPVKRLLKLHPIGFNGFYNPRLTETPAEKLYGREIYVYWAYCDLFRGNINWEISLRDAERFEWPYRKAFLIALLCPPPAFWHSWEACMDRIFENKHFKLPMPSNSPVAWQSAGLSGIIGRLLLHRGLTTLRIIASNVPVIDGYGNVNRAQLPSDVADEVVTVIAGVCGRLWREIPRDLIYDDFGRWQADDYYHWFSMESDHKMLLPRDWNDSGADYWLPLDRDEIPDEDIESDEQD